MFAQILLLFALLRPTAAGCAINPDSNGHVDIDNTNTDIPDMAYYECTGLVSVTIANTVTSIGTAAFASSNLVNVTIPNSVNQIKDNTFAECSNLETVSLPNTIESIGASAFYQCTSLKSISLPDSVQTIGAAAFGGSSKLAEVTVPDGISSIGNNAFAMTSSDLVCEKTCASGKRSFNCKKGANGCTVTQIKSLECRDSSEEVACSLADSAAAGWDYVQALAMVILCTVYFK